MTKLRDAPWHSNVFFCACMGKDHLISITFDDDDPDFRFLEISDNVRPQGIWNKIKTAVDVMRGKDFVIGSVLLDKENLQDFIDVLIKHNYIAKYGNEFNNSIKKIQESLVEYDEVVPSSRGKHIAASEELAKNVIELMNIIERGHSSESSVEQKSEPM